MYRRKEHPIIEAVMLGDTYIVEELLEKGSNIDQENKLGKTLLQIALDKKDYEMALFLLENGADVSKINQVRDLYDLSSCIAPYKDFCRNINKNLMKPCGYHIKIDTCHDNELCRVFNIPWEVYSHVYIMTLSKNREVLSSLLFYFMEVGDDIYSGFHVITEVAYRGKGYVTMLISLFMVSWPLGVNFVGCNAENVYIKRIMTKLEMTEKYIDIPAMTYISGDRRGLISRASKLLLEALKKTCSDYNSFKVENVDLTGINIINEIQGI